MNDGMSLAEREQLIYANMSRKLTDTGERERIKEWLSARLEECGWKDQLKKDCIQFSKQRANKSQSDQPVDPNQPDENYLNDVTIDELLKHFLSKSKDNVPLGIKMELLQRLRKFLTSSSKEIAPSSSN